MRIEKSSQPLVILLATVVAILTSMVVANATQTITTPNAVKITYSLAPGASSAAITPATNTSVLVMGCSTNESGVGQVSLLHRPSSGMYWLGLESYAGSVITRITGGSISTPGTHIMWISSANNVEIEVASADTIIIRNSQGTLGTIAGNVTLIW
jgi:hypothetical protein